MSNISDCENHYLARKTLFDKEMKTIQFKVKFWGVRGSLPIPGKNTLEFGGNTPCVEVRIGKRLLILDGGTGIHHLGEALIRTGQRITADIFITHTHWDHIHGFPFFAPAFVKGNAFTLHGQGKLNNTFANLMRGQMMDPHFPILLDQMGAVIDFQEIHSGVELNLGDGIVVRTIHNNHPGGCLSYRIEQGGRVCCYVTDVEHYAVPTPHLVKFVQGADLVIYDACYTDEEYAGIPGFPSRVGWGHSTWQEGIKLVKSAGAKKLVLFHHATHRTDTDMRKIERAAQKKYPDCVGAREGAEIAL
ncbi:MAG: MBL fold metallo-hydrolase [Solirubrobacterales bacterium]